MSISTKEQLKTHVHQIHNLIRNSGAGYGLDALKIFNFFYGLKILEPDWEKFELKSKKFSELVKISKKYINDESNQKILIELFGDKDGSPVIITYLACKNGCEGTFGFIVIASIFGILL